MEIFLILILLALLLSPLVCFGLIASLRRDVKELRGQLEEMKTPLAGKKQSFFIPVSQEQTSSVNQKSVSEPENAPTPLVASSLLKEERKEEPKLASEQKEVIIVRVEKPLEASANKLIFEASAQKSSQEADPAQAHSFSWEYFLGAKLLAWMGGLFLLLGMVYFTKYSIERDLISPEVRVLISFVFAALLVGGGIAVRARGNGILGQTLTAVGISTAYLSTCAGYLYYHFAFFSWGVSGGLLLAITALAFYLSVSWRSQVVALLGMVAAFALPFILSRGTGNVVGFFSYMLLLNTVLWLLIWKCRWGYMLLISSLVTVLLVSFWAGRYYEEDYQYGLLGCALFFLGGFTWVLLKQVAQKEKQKSLWRGKEQAEARLFYGFSIASVGVVLLYFGVLSFVLLQVRHGVVSSPVLFWGLWSVVVGLTCFLAWKVAALRYSLVVLVLPSYGLMMGAFDVTQKSFGYLSVSLFFFLWVGYLLYPRKIEQKVDKEDILFRSEQKGFLKAASFLSLMLTLPCFVELWTFILRKNPVAEMSWMPAPWQFFSLSLLFVGLVVGFSYKTGRVLPSLAFYLGFLLVFGSRWKSETNEMAEILLCWLILALGVVLPFFFWKRLQKNSSSLDKTSDKATGVFAYESSSGQGRQNLLWGISGWLLLVALFEPYSLCSQRTMFVVVLGVSLAALAVCSAFYVVKDTTEKSLEGVAGRVLYRCAQPMSLILYFCLFFLSLNLYLWDVFSGQNVTLLLGLEALIYVGAGFYFSLRSLRLLGIGLLAFCVIKLLSYDLRELSQLYRVASVMGVAVISLLASLFYQKFLKKKFLLKEEKDKKDNS